MAPLPRLRPDPFKPSPPAGDPALSEAAADRKQEDASRILERVATTLAPYGGTAAGLALDLILNQIAEQAREAVGASGAAVALFQGAEMVCRATTGSTAPDLGVRFSADSGLSGACVRSRQVQRCDDTEADLRVDPQACRRLGVRSMVVLPLLDQGELPGVLEVFFPRPRTLAESEIRVLQDQAEHIVHNVRQAASRAAVQPPLPSPQSPIEASSPILAQLAEAVATAGEPPEVGERRPDYWTGLLAVIVLGMALLLIGLAGLRLGWLGAGADHRPVTRKTAPPTETPPRATPSLQSSGPVPAAPSSTADSSARPKKPAGPPPGGLVIYQEGKLVFRMAPGEPSATAPAQDAVASRPVTVLPEVAAGLLLHRVEPEYPAEARQAHLQGPVILRAVIGQDGAIQKLSLISGDPRLAEATMAAVHQWRYQPYKANGRPVEVETQITIHFTLP